MPGHEKILQEYKYRKPFFIQNVLIYAVRIFLCVIVNKVVSDASVLVEEFWSLSRRHSKYLQLENVSLELECSLSKEQNTYIYKIHTHTHTHTHK